MATVRCGNCGALAQVTINTEGYLTKAGPGWEKLCVMAKEQPIGGLPACAYFRAAIELASAELKRTQ